MIRGRRRELGLGGATLVPLAKARELALANRMLARSGGDPLSEKRRVQGVPTFAETAHRRTAERPLAARPPPGGVGTKPIPSPVRVRLVPT